MLQTLPFIRTAAASGTACTLPFATVDKRSGRRWGVAVRSCAPLSSRPSWASAHRIMGCGARSASEAYRIVGMSCGGARRRDHLFTRRSSSSIPSVGRAVRRRVSRSRAREFAARTQLRPQHPRPQSSPRRSVARKRTFKLLADSRAKCVSRSFTTTAEQSADAEHSGFFVLGFR